MTIEYVAGFFDGEGSITTAGSGRSQNVQCCVTNTNKEILDLFQSIYGGHVYARKSKNINAKQAYGWHLYKNDDFLELILPHLFLKKKQCELAIKYRKLVKNNLGPVKIDKKVKEERDQIAKEIHYLNKRGK
jgi:hypothetical protein